MDIAVTAVTETLVVSVRPPKEAVIVVVPAVESVLPSAGLKVQSAVTSFVKAPAVAVTTRPVRSKVSPRM